MVIEYLFPLISILAAITESYFDSKGKSIEHNFSAGIRVALAVSCSFYLLNGIYYISIYTIILLNSFWIVFDPMYNYFKGKTGIWYIGNTSPVDQIARVFFNSEGGGFYLCAKFLLMVFLLIAYSF